MDILSTTHSDFLKKAIQVYDKQHRTITENIANVNNSDYARKNTNFLDELNASEENQRIRQTNPRHLGASEMETIPGSAEGENGVELTQEMSDLAQNQIKHEFVSMMLSRYYDGLSSAIKGQSR